MSLVISAEHLERIRRHGCEDYPNECCGLLIGRIDNGNRLVTELLPMGNSREDFSKRNRYLISPIELLRADRDAQKRGLDILGIYHSHPDHPARPSEYDREHALPWYSYIIVSVNGGTAGDLASWNLRDDRSAFDREGLAGDPEEENSRTLSRQE